MTNQEKLLAILEKIGVTLKEDEALYNAAIQKAEHADKLAIGFNALQAAGTTLKENEVLYNALIQNAEDAEELASGFNALQAAGTTLKENEVLYNALIDDAKNADELAIGFNALQAVGATLKENKAFYNSLMLNSMYAGRLGRGFNALQAAGITLEENEVLYNALIKNAPYAETLGGGFSALQAAGATRLENTALYDALIQNACYTKSLGRGFNALKAAGATLKVNKALYTGFIEKARYAYKLASGFNALQAAGATVNENEALYNALIQNADQVYCVQIELEKSQELGLKSSWDRYISLTPNADFTGKLAIGLGELEASNIALKENKALCSALIQNVYQLDDVESGFNALKAAGATLKENEVLYLASFQLAYYADKLAIGFDTLQAEGATLKENAALYKILIQHARYANKLASGINVLQAAGATLKENAALYNALIQKADYADKLEGRFNVLQAAGATIKENEVLYKAVIQEVGFIDYSAKLESGFNALQAVGATLEKHEALYEALIRKANYADKLAVLFNRLHSDGATLKDNAALYNVLIQKAHYADELGRGFNALQAAGLTLKENEALYNALIQNAHYADKLVIAFNTLKTAGATLKEKEALYNALIQNARYADELARGFNALHAVGATLKENEALYSAAIQNARYANTLEDIFNQLNHIGLSLKADSAVYELAIQQSDMNYLINCLAELNIFHMKAPDDRDIIEQCLRHSEYSLDVLKWLKTHGFTYAAHREVFYIYFTKDSPLMDSPYLTSKVNIKLQAYLGSKQNVLLSPGDDGYTAQVQEIKTLIDEVINAEKETLTEGPLNKSSSTSRLEAILKRMANVSMSDVHMRYDEAFGYILKLGQEPEIYVNELLRLTNFNHITLTEAEVNLLGKQIQNVTEDFDTQKLSDANILVERLPDAARRAISCYIGDRRYKNMNKLFRGVAQDSDEYYRWLAPVNGKNNLIANFLAGCLVNWSAAELPRVLIRSEERQILEKVFLNQKPAYPLKEIKKNEALYLTLLQNNVDNKRITEAERDKVKLWFSQLTFLFPSYSLIDRAENLNASEVTELETVKRRIANPVIVPSVLSFSVLHEGSPAFHNPDTTRTKVETDNSIRPVVNPGEGEILIPAGTSYRYTLNTNQGTFFAREVNSPGILPQGDFWSSTALAESFRHHLSKPYEGSNQEEHNVVSRPNHGLAHTYRVVVYLDVIIDYFAHHAKDETFRLFCQHITPDEREWLRVAAAFSISGRESEISAGENPEQYDQFRQASQKHMEDFLENYPPPTDNAAMRERMLDIVRWMGNPNYEKGIDGQHEHLDPDERLHRHFIHRILSIAHKLDLPRCYLPAEFEGAMAKCLELSTVDELQKADYMRMIRYAIDIIKAHGNRLQTDITSGGELQSADKGYTAPFEKVSTNLRQLREITETITQPQRKESYQLPQCTNEDMMNRVLKMCGGEKIKWPDEPKSRD